MQGRPSGGGCCTRHLLRDAHAPLPETHCLRVLLLVLPVLLPPLLLLLLLLLVVLLLMLALMLVVFLLVLLVPLEQSVASVLLVLLMSFLVLLEILCCPADAWCSFCGGLLVLLGIPPMLSTTPA